MSRADGFTVMDVSTDICNDPKFRRLHRHNPEHVAPAFVAYVAVLGESWKAGRRVTVVDAWPVLLPHDPDVIESMKLAGLLDKSGRLPVKPWNGWYEPARERRDKARARWTRYNATRNVDTAFDDGGTTVVPRGSDAATATSVRTVPSVPSGPTGPSVPSNGRAPRAAKDDGQMPDTKEERREALLLASEHFREGRITEMEYARIRRELSA